MKFSEVKPFLMAGFKVDCAPYPKPEFGCYWRLVCGKFYRFIENVKYEEWGLQGIECSGDSWKVLDADPEKLTREQAIRLMDAGYKISCHTARSGSDFYFKKGNEIFYRCEDMGGEWKETSFFGDYNVDYKLYDNELVKQKIELTTGKVIAMGCESNIQKPLFSFDYLNQFAKNHFDKINKSVKELIASGVTVDNISETVFDGENNIVTTISYKEKPMNQSFLKIKPFVLAGFKFTFKGNTASFWYIKKFNMVFNHCSCEMEGLGIAHFENHRTEEYYLLPNQQDHSKNLSYEQAKVLVEAGYSVTSNMCGTGVFYKKVNGAVKYIYELYEGIPSFFKHKDNYGKDIIFSLIEPLPTTEKTEMSFNFTQAVKYMKEGRKVVLHDDGYSSFYYYANFEFKDERGDIVEFDAGDIIDSAWSLYEEPAKFTGVGDGKNQICLKETPDCVFLQIDRSNFRVIHDNNILVKFYKNGTIRLDKKFLEKEGYKLEILE